MFNEALSFDKYTLLSHVYFSHSKTDYKALNIRPRVFGTLYVILICYRMFMQHERPLGKLTVLLYLGRMFRLLISIGNLAPV